MFERNQRILFFSLLIVIALGAMATLYVSTQAGLGFTNDSVAYVGAARNILTGNGYARTSGGGEIKPLTHYPPLFSMLLAAGSALTQYDPIRVARALIVLLWGLSTLLGGWLVWRISRSMIAGLVFAFLFAADGTLLFVYAVIMSEPLYLALTFAAFLLLFAYCTRLPSPASTLHPFPPEKARLSSVGDGRGNGGTERGWPWLIATGAASGLAYLTRYSGLALLATIGVTLCVVEPTWKRKIRSVLVYLGGAIPFMLAWTLRNSLRGLSITNRVLSYHPIPAEKIDYGFHQVWNWLIPLWFGGFTSDWPVFSLIKASRAWPGTPYLGLGLIGVGLLVWLAVSARRLWGRGALDAPLAVFFTCTLYVVVYLAAIVFSMFFFDASTSFQDRILAPVYISLLIAIVLLGVWLWRSGRRSLQVLVIVLALAVSVVSVADASQAVVRLQSDPLGYASAHWRNSKTIAAVNALPANTVIYSSSPTIVYILTNRPAYIIPTPIDPVDNQPRGSYADDVAQMRADLLAGKTVLVIFQADRVKPAIVAELTAGIPVYFSAGDGQIYGQP